MSSPDGWWNRNEGKPEGPGGIPWWVWVALGLVMLYALYVALSGDDREGPGDPERSLPTRPAVIMPVNSWSS